MLGEKEMSTKNNKVNLKRSLLTGATALALIGSFATPQTAQAKGPELDAEASIIVDYETDQILQGHAIDEPLGIASISKMLAEYIVFEEIDAGNIDWDTEIKISDYAYRISQDYELSNVPLRNGELYTLEELYHAMAIYSANGATIAIAEEIEGTEEAFVDRMQETVEAFGIEDATLYNSTGLNNNYLGDNIYPGSSSEDENTMSARSVAKITSRLITDYPEILEIASIPTMTFREGTIDAIDMTNWNLMLEGLLMERPGVDGLKTGTTKFAGPTFTGTAKEDGRRLVTVVLNSGDDLETRFRETSKLMDYGFDKFTSESVVSNWEENLDYVPLTVVNGKQDVLDYEPSEELEMLIQSGDKLDDELTYSIEWNQDVIDEDESIFAPVKEGTELGRLVINYSGNDHGYLNGGEKNSVPLVAKNTVEKAGIFSQLWNGTTNFFKGLMGRFN